MAIKVERMAFLSIFHVCVQILPQLRNFFQKSKCAHHPRAINAAFVPNLTFLGLLSLETSFGDKKTSSHLDTQPADFAIREPQ